MKYRLTPYDATAPIKTRPRRAPAPALSKHAVSLVRDLAFKTRYMDPALGERWADFVGRDLARCSRPGRMSGGGRDRSVEVFVTSGGAATQVAMAAQAIIARLNNHLGPGVVGRLVVRQLGADDAPAGGPSKFFD